MCMEKMYENQLPFDTSENWMQIKRTGILVMYYYNDINILSCTRAYFSNDERFGCNTAHLIYNK